MLDRITLYVLVDTTVRRGIHAICVNVDEAEHVRREILAMLASAPVSEPGATNLEIHAMNAEFPGDRYRLVYGRPASMPAHPLEVPRFLCSRLTNADGYSDAYLYPDELFVHRKQALAAAAKHNLRQFRQAGHQPLDWAVVVEIGEPLWRRYHSECLVRRGLGWEETDLVRPVHVIQPTEGEVTSARKSQLADTQDSSRG
ncbi:MAG: hypothetical protein ACLP9L_06605 [Thermoguttaceae bacterium]